MGFGDTSGFSFNICLAALTALTFIYDVITLPIYAIIQNPIKVKQLAKKKLAVPIHIDEKSITYRSIDPVSKYHAELENNKIESIAAMLEYCSKKHENGLCLGTREIISEVDEVQPDGKVFKKFKMGDYKWKSCKEINELASNFGKGLCEIGLKHKTNVVIFGETREEWLISAHGLFKQNFVLVTIYATLGEDGIIHSINETEATTIITSEDLLPKVAKVLPHVKNVENVIFIENQLRSNVEEIKLGDVQVLTYKDVVALGSKSDLDENLPQPNDTAIIMYTSGSTGTPKGVILTHKNIIATLKGFADSTDLYPTDVIIAFLPLAHVYEILVENFCLFVGMKIGYSNPLTLLNTSSKIMKGCKGDASALKPTVMTSVPLILGRIADGIRTKVGNASFLVRLLFNFAYQYKVRWMSRGFSTPILDRIVFKGVRALVGGRIRLMVAGGSPLTAEIHELVKMCFCTNLIQGYGLTESTSCCSVQKIYDLSYERVGPPMTSADLKLIDFEEGNYTIKDVPYPRGEIVLGGDMISRGYFKLPDQTQEVFYNENGKWWFKTGDIGEIQTDGVLKIIDRKKDLVKLQMGEYIALGKVENKLKSHQLVSNICIYGDSTQIFCVALIEADRDKLKEFAEKIGIENKSFEELCDNVEVNAAVTVELAKFGKNIKLEKYEIPKSVTLVKETWDVESGLVTATFKLRRRDIENKYKSEIKKMYHNN